MLCYFVISFQQALPISGRSPKRTLKKTVVSKHEKVANLVNKFSRGRAASARLIDGRIIVAAVTSGLQELEKYTHEDMSIDGEIAKLTSTEMETLSDFSGGQGSGGMIRKIPRIAEFVCPVLAELDIAAELVARLTEGIKEGFAIRFAQRYNRADGEGDEACVDPIGFKASLDKCILDKRVEEALSARLDAAGI